MRQEDVAQFVFYLLDGVAFTSCLVGFLPELGREVVDCLVRSVDASLVAVF
jgi:hypothetical protein